MTRSRTVTVLGAIASLAVATTAHADAPANRAAAEKLDADGTALMQEHRYAEACASFAESERLAPGTGVLLRLGLCNELVGKTATAWAAFHEAAARAQRAGDDAVLRLATKRADAVAGRVPKVVIAPPLGAKPETLDVTCDGAPVARETLGGATPMDPGTHTIEAAMPGHPPFRTTFTLAARPDVVTITLAVPSEGATSDGDVSASPGGATRRDAALVLGGVGVAALVVGAVFGLEARSNWNRATGECASGTSGCTDDALGLQSVVRNEALVSTIAFVAGGASLAGAIFLWWTAPRASVALGHVGYLLAPAIGVGEVGFEMIGRF